LARGFTDRERDSIRRDLIRKGREFFGNYGLKKTGIEDLTKAVGIAQGSFYSFFDSKDELYLEVVDREEDLIREEFFKNYLGKGKLTREKFKDSFKKAIDIVNSNPIIKRVYVKDEFELLVRNMSPERIKEDRVKVLKNLLPLIEKWQREGTMIKKPPEVIAQVIIESFPTIHKQDADEDIFEGTMELYLDILAKGLIVEENDKL